MPAAKLSEFLTRFARGLPDAASAPDADLLARFISTRDEAAFTELVYRYGPLVHGVCRRVTGNHHLAEDAFQAVFVVLAAKAGCVRPAASLPGWLHAVACRTALRARSMNDRRRRREKPVEHLPEAAGQEPDAVEASDLAAILDEEIAKLPESQRLAVVLCELEGCPRKAAAQRIGVAEGTLSSRLASARKSLATRLRRRGVALSAAALSVALGGQASARVSADLAARAVAAATSPASIPAAVAALSKGVLQTMLIKKLTVAAVAAVVLLAVGAYVVATPSAAPPEAPKPAPVFVRADDKKPQPAPQNGVLMVTHYESTDRGVFHLIDSDGKKLQEFKTPKETAPGGVGLSPDGKRAAMVIGSEKLPRKGEEVQFNYKIMVWTLGKAEPDAVFDLPGFGLYPHPRWTADSKHIVAPAKPNNISGSVLIDPATGDTKALDLPKDCSVVDCGRDGKTFVVVTRNQKTGKHILALATLGSADLVELTDVSGLVPAALSPDGNQVLFIDSDPTRKDAYRWGWSARVFRIDVKTKKRAPMEFPETGEAYSVAWSPDGTKIAYCWKQLPEKLQKMDNARGINVNRDLMVETKAYVVITDPDGKNPKTIVTGKAPNVFNPILGQIDWKPVPKAAPPEVAPPPEAPKLAPALVAPAVVPEDKEPPLRVADDVPAPIAYDSLMLILASKEGTAAVVFSDADDTSVTYKFRYESADGKTAKIGEGKVFEARDANGKYDEANSKLHIKAGPIYLRWSTGDKDCGWIYYSPETLTVHLAHSTHFVDVIDPAGKVELKQLDLKRFMRK